MTEEKKHANQAVLFAVEFTVQGIWDAEDLYAFFNQQCRSIFMLAWRQALEAERKRKPWEPTQ